LGFADTIRAGLEGRAFAITAFGRSYFKSGPIYFFPGVIALKLPISLGTLQHAPNDAVLRHSIEDQIKRVSFEALDRVPELRNPFLE
jgi:hypothetical protein